jgi:hypothetical protein
MIGNIKSTALEHDRRSGVNAVNFPMAGWAADFHLVESKRYVFLKFLSAYGTGIFIKWHTHLLEEIVSINIKGLRQKNASPMLIKCQKPDLFPADKNLFDFFPAEINEPVTDPALGQDVLGIGRILFQFLAQVVDIEPHVMGFVTVFIPPYFGQQLIV